ncbi:TetR/AcrR family transcriptional regulator [Mycolicibacterium llatzerense]|uniref:TetR/AcrR family transcriptional regulator n=1 Tax=Mycolicibacterium llatzerense TaxID=280871 RepID=UPI0008DE2EBA|nr:TetR/AcrR family transcriptional regulator [Mycolicibacterium llatzerense]
MRTVIYEAAPEAPVEPSSLDKILAAATVEFAEHGSEGMTIRKVGEAADVSTGLVQHYFKTKKDLLEATNQYVLKQISTIVEVPDSHDLDMLTAAGNTLVNIFVEQPHLIAFITRSIVERGEAGRVMFRWFYELADAQGDWFDERGMLPEGLDRVWAALNVVILRVGAFILADHIDELLPAPFKTPEQIHRWEASVNSLIRNGQLNEPRSEAAAE